MNDCIFCKIVAGEIPATKIRETEDTYSFLDIRPINTGHTLVIPKKHYASLLDIPEDLLAKVIVEVKRTAIAIKKVTGADGINLGQNNEAGAGQVVHHLHFHVMPRFANDGYVLWSPKTEIAADPELAQKIAEAI